MNKIHTLKWSRLLSAWVVVSEIASSVGGKAKRTCRHRARTLLQAGLVIGMVGMPLTWVVAAPSLNVNNIKVTKLTPVVDAKLEVPNLNVGTELSVSYSFSENHPTETRKDKSRYWWHYAKDKLSAEDLRAEIKDKGTEVASGVIPPRKITPEDVSAKSDLELSILPEDDKGVEGKVVTVTAWKALLIVVHPTVEVQGNAIAGGPVSRLVVGNAGDHDGTPSYTTVPPNSSVATIDEHGVITWHTGGIVRFRVSYLATATHAEVRARTGDVNVAFATSAYTLSIDTPVSPAAVGHTLTATALTANTAAGITGWDYQWTVGTTVHPSTTSNTYILVAEDLGQAIRVTARATVAAGAPAVELTSRPVTPYGTSTHTLSIGAPASPAAIGHTLTATDLVNVTAANAAAGIIGWNYQWTVGGTNKGSNSHTYTLAADDLGKAIRVTATPTVAAGAPTVAVLSSNPVTPYGSSTHSLSIGAPASPAAIGHTLTATDLVNVTAANAAAGITGWNYQWMVGGTNKGSNSHTYTLVADDLGKAIRVTATPTVAAGAPTVAVLSSNPVTPYGSSTHSLSISIPASPAAVGNVLTATDLVNVTSANTAAGITGWNYQWMVGGTNKGSNSHTYTLVADDLGKAIRVTATPTVAAGAPTVAVLSSNPVTPYGSSTHSLSISAPASPAAIGHTLTATDLVNATAANAAAGIIGWNYQWNVGGTNKGSNSHTYTLAADDLGKAIRVTATPTVAAGAPTVAVLSSNPVTPYGSSTHTLSIGAPASPAAVGNVLTATDLANMTAANTAAGISGWNYQWTIGGTNKGSNSRTYTLVADDLGKAIRVTATPTVAAGAPTVAVLSSNPVTPYGSSTHTLSIGAPASPAAVGNVLTATDLVNATAANTAAGITGWNYQWTVGGTNKGSNSRTYTLVAEDLGKAIRVTATPTVATGAPTVAVLSSNPVTPYGSSTHSLSISTPASPAAVGNVLTATDLVNATAANAAAGITGWNYQWTVGGTNKGSNSRTYTLAADDLGKAIRVTATPTVAAGALTVAVLSSNPVTPYGSSIHSLSISTPASPAAVGNVLTATDLVNATAANAAAGITGWNYQWTVGGTNKGSNSHTYTLVADDLGQHITVTARATVAPDAPAVELTSTPVTPFAAASFNAPTIEGTVAANQTLTATAPTVTDATTMGNPAMTWAYQWQRSSDGGTNWTDIGSTSAATTYRLTDAERGHTIRVRATSGTTTVTSNPRDTAVPFATATSTGNVTLVTIPTVGNKVLAIDTLNVADATTMGAHSKTYQWSRGNGTDWAVIDSSDNGLNKDRIPTDADRGKQLRLEVKLIKVVDQSVTSTKVAVSTQLPYAEPVLSGSPIMTGTTAMGGTLTATPPIVTNAANAGTSGWTYQWYRNSTASATGGTAITTNGTSASYNVLTVDENKYLYVIVTPNRQGTPVSGSGRSSAVTPVITELFHKGLYYIHIGSLDYDIAESTCRSKGLRVPTFAELHLLKSESVSIPATWPLAKGISYLSYWALTSLYDNPAQAIVLASGARTAAPRHEKLPTVCVRP